MDLACDATTLKAETLSIVLFTYSIPKVVDMCKNVLETFYHPRGGMELLLFGDMTQGDLNPVPKLEGVLFVFNFIN